MSAAGAGAGAGPGMVPPPEDAYDAHLDKVLNELQRLYHTHVAELERRFEYDQYRPSWFPETIVQKKPFVTFLGPFSAGKSTFINYLMQSNYLLTGPQPVTDKFTVIMHGDEVEQIPGRVLIADPKHPFRGLSQFGDSFVECFNCMLAPHPILKSVSLIDTPGVLEAAGDIHQRRYDYVKVCRWFIERSDLVFFLFDPTKLDAGVELRMLFKYALRGFENRTRIVLNKADTVGPQELMRVYGSLFWNLSNLINTTEPPRVYVSSFWDRPYKPGTDHKLFTDEKSDLLYDLTEVVPLQSLDKRVTSVLRRAQEVYNHTLVCATMRQAMPSIFGKDKAKKEALQKLPDTVESLSQKFRVSAHDFGSQDDYVKFFEKVDLFTLPDMDKCAKKQWLINIKRLIETDLPALLKPIKAQSVVDPRDKKHAIMVQRQYQAQLQDQIAGKDGQQGALGQMRAPTYMQGLAVPTGNVQLAGAGGAPGGMVPLASQPSIAPLVPQSGMAGAAPAVDPAQAQMMQMQMQMQMMQMQMAQQASPVTQMPSVAAPMAAPAAAPSMTPEQMQMLMAQMQAQQQAQQ